MDVCPRRNIMDDLLKEAIADAKAVRETALENAKIALEEAFTPRLQSMLSKKIQSEIEAEGAHEDDEDVDERMHDEDEDDMDEKMRLKADDEDPTDDASEGAHEDDEDVEERMHGEEEDDDVEERMHDEDEDEKKDEAMHDEDEDDMEEDLDLEAVLKELENEAMHDEDEDEVEEGMHDEDEDDEKEESVDENDVSSGIGKGDNAHDKKSGDSTDIGKAGKAKFESKEQVEEDIDLDEVLKALTEEDEVEEEVNEVTKLQSELEEHRDVVKYLRGKLNEVNLLNAKLLFTNKLFRAYGLSNDQKMKVVETFDRATNLREVKLVYSTLAESFGTKVKKEIKESKGSASKAVASTKSEKQEVIAEGSELRDRFKKLAGII